MIRWIATVVLVSLLLSGCDSVKPSEDIPEVEWIQIPDSDWVAAVAPGGDLIRMESDRLLRSSDHGDSWTSSEPSVPDGWLEFQELKAVGSSGEIIVELDGRTQGEGPEDYRGLARSKDGGATFEEISTEWLGPENFFVAPVHVWIDDVNTLFANPFYKSGGGPRLFRLEPGEMTWSTFFPFEDYDPIVNVSFDQEGRLYMLSVTGSTYRSRDRGRNWQLLPDEQFTLSGRPILPDTRRIYRTGINPSSDPGSSTHGLFTSEDEGTSWYHLDFFTPVQSVSEVVFGTNGHLFTIVEESQNELMFRSADEGVSWEKVNSGLPASIVENDSIQLNGLTMGTDGYLYVRRNNSVYRTTESVGGNE